MLIEKIIADFQERDLPSLTLRHQQLPAVPGKIDSIIGMRRTGKTFFIYQIIADILSRGIEKSTVLYINFDDDRLYPLTAADLHRVTDVYHRLYPENKNRLCHFFFDEIQNIQGWERFVRRLIDTENVQIALTGSSAKLLSHEIATTLRGRSIATEIFPFSFTEVLSHEGIVIDASPRPGAKQRALLQNRFRNFLTAGGFPEVQNIAAPLRIRILQEYVDVVILRDVVERYKIGNIQPLRAMIRHLLSAPATMFSVNKFYNDLKSHGISCGKNTLHELFDHLCDAYLLYPVSIYSRSQRAKRVNPRKVYAIDSGLAHAFAHSPTAGWGHLLENVVFMELRRRNLAIEYYRTKNGFEVDFITTSHDGTLMLIQVSARLADPDTRYREIRALSDAMEETGIPHGTILTLDDEEIIETRHGDVNILPAWLWMLKKSGKV